VRLLLQYRPCQPACTLVRGNRVLTAVPSVRRQGATPRWTPAA